MPKLCSQIDHKKAVNVLCWNTIKSRDLFYLYILYGHLRSSVGSHVQGVFIQVLH